uniref:Uncharacterized protein n=1 Tax=Rhizophagus irregularis (strain DAOM 181602 / DAOM 197198 / MUCL 43194) TaxID=747089 RepID=U9U7A7_RHIID
MEIWRGIINLLNVALSGLWSLGIKYLDIWPVLISKCWNHKIWLNLDSESWYNIVYFSFVGFGILILVNKRNLVNFSEESHLKSTLHKERRNILHESPNNVAFRCRYLRFRFANLEGQNDVPHRPEVFLDESYCHLHHISRNTWVPHQGVVLSPGHGPLVVIFEAIIVF